MTTRILLTDPKFPHNVGQAVRAGSCFGVDKVWMTGNRVALEGDGKKYRLPREERMRGEYVPVEKVEGKIIDQAISEGFTPVAVELVSGAEMLPYFIHPENPLYIFGPEDGSLDSGILSACHRFVQLAAWDADRNRFVPTALPHQRAAGRKWRNEARHHRRRSEHAAAIRRRSFGLGRNRPCFDVDARDTEVSKPHGILRH